MSRALIFVCIHLAVLFFIDIEGIWGDIQIQLFNITPSYSVPGTNEPPLLSPPPRSPFSLCSHICPSHSFTLILFSFFSGLGCPTITMYARNVRYSIPTIFHESNEALSSPLPIPFCRRFFTNFEVLPPLTSLFYLFFSDGAGLNLCWRDILDLSISSK